MNSFCFGKFVRCTQSWAVLISCFKDDYYTVPDHCCLFLVAADPALKPMPLFGKPILHLLVREVLGCLVLAHLLTCTLSFDIFVKQFVAHTFYLILVAYKPSIHLTASSEDHCPSFWKLQVVPVLYLAPHTPGELHINLTKILHKYYNIIYTLCGSHM